MKELNGKVLYTPKGAAREYAAVGCNFYKGCPHGCTYCYLKRGVLGKELGGTEVELKKCFKDEWDALEVFAREFEKNLEVIKKYGIFFSFTTDPMIKQTRSLTLSAMKKCVERGVPVTILTKNADFVSNGDVMYSFLLDTKFLQREKVAFGFTLTGHDEMEPNASSNLNRINAMRNLKQLGFRTWASIEPIIDFEASLRMIKESADCCDHYKIGLRSGVKKDYYDPEECIQFIEEVNDMLAPSKTIYWKESVRKLIKDYTTLGIIDKDPKSVGRDFSLFDTEE